MKYVSSNTLVFLVLCFCTSTLWSQNVFLKPYAGWLLPSMSNVNSNIRQQVDSYRDFLEEPIPGIDEIDGNRTYGISIEYLGGGDMIASVNLGYYEEAVSSSYASTVLPGSAFDYERQVKMYDFLINLHYYFNYNSWRRLNYFLGFGFGYVVANAESKTDVSYTTDASGDPLPATISPVNSSGSFTGNSLSAVISAGGDIRMNPYLMIFGEIGIIYGNIGEMEGTVRDLDNPQGFDIATQSEFNFTGPYIKAGIGFSLPFLH